MSREDTVWNRMIKMSKNASSAVIRETEKGRMKFLIMQKERKIREIKTKVRSLSLTCHKMRAEI